MSITVPCYAITPAAYRTILGLNPNTTKEELVSFMDEPQMFNWKVELPNGFRMRRINIIEANDKKDLAFWKVLSMPLKLDPVCIHLKSEIPAIKKVSSRIVEANDTFRFRLAAPETVLVFRETAKEEYVIHPRIEEAFALELARWRKDAPHAEAHLINAKSDMLTDVSYVEYDRPRNLN